MKTEFETHRFAWDGLSFSVPVDWNLSSYNFEKRFSTIKMEDAIALRLELEWVRIKKSVDVATVRKRYESLTSTLSEAAARVKQTDRLPPAWTVFRYVMEDGKQLAVALFAPQDGGVLCMFRIHFDKPGNAFPNAVIRAIADSAVVHADEFIPWQCYDVEFSLSRDFRLVNTSLQAGRKLMVFQWRLRRVYVWTFSLADILLKNKPINEWASEFLNAFKQIPRPRFFADRGGRVGVRRRWLQPFGHYDEIGRMCFRYHVAYQHDTGANLLRLVVYNYRKESDLEKLPSTLRISR